MSIIPNQTEPTEIIMTINGVPYSYAGDPGSYDPRYAQATTETMRLFYQRKIESVSYATDYGTEGFTITLVHTKNYNRNFFDLNAALRSTMGRVDLIEVRFDTPESKYKYYNMVGAIVKPSSGGKGDKLTIEAEGTISNVSA